ncbi:hypothetical protein LR68_03096 [Anoxybacillus sp. BCO1]|nr:hypothetical protein LR68_03096 [Anoxybacillus sp. BCO1]
MLIRHVPPDERPRERLLSEGPQSLSNQELLAILLRTGTKQYSVLTLAQHLLTHFEGLRQLKDATIEEMTSIKGSEKQKRSKLLQRLNLADACINFNTMIVTSFVLRKTVRVTSWKICVF